MPWRSRCMACTRSSRSRGEAVELAARLLGLLLGPQIDAAEPLALGPRGRRGVASISAWRQSPPASSPAARGSSAGVAVAAPRRCARTMRHGARRGRLEAGLAAGADPRARRPAASCAARSAVGRAHIASRPAARASAARRPLLLGRGDQRRAAPAPLGDAARRFGHAGDALARLAAARLQRRDLAGGALGALRPLRLSAAIGPALLARGASRLDPLGLGAGLAHRRARSP